MKKLIVAIVFVLLFSSLSFAKEELIMTGKSKKAKATVTAKLYYGKERSSWGYASFYCKLVIENSSDYPVLLDSKKDKYYLVAANGKKRTITINKTLYPKFVNPQESEEIPFSEKAYAMLQKELSGARSFIIELDRAQHTIKLRPQRGSIDIPALERSLK